MSCVKSTAIPTGYTGPGHAGSKTLLQKNPPVVDLGCQLTQVDLCNDCKMVVVQLNVTNSAVNTYA